MVDEWTDGRWERDSSVLTMKCTSRVAKEKEEALDEEAELKDGQRRTGWHLVTSLLNRRRSLF
jgi:hypothetical protein